LVFCVYEQTDPNNCGGCGITCPAAAPSCQFGACTDGVDANLGVEAGEEPGGASCGPGGPGMSNCGPGGSGTESCCTSLEVTGGTYYRTYDPRDGNGGVILAADGGPSGEADPATVSSFRLDKYLVTVGRFRQFVSAWSVGSGWLPPGGSGKHVHLNGGAGLVNAGQPGTYEPGWLASDDAAVEPTSSNLACGLYGWVGNSSGTWTLSPGANENLPINCVNWWEAYAFCIWDGGFLPSEAEWECASAGGSQQRMYPWGSKDPGTGNEFAIYGCYYPSGSPDASSFSCASVANIAPVGTARLGAGLWGQLDLAGEVWVWNLDRYAAYVPCTDCADFTASDDNRILQGSGFSDSKVYLVPASRENLNGPALRSSDQGFRCARSP
jgi:formylglycine-generating enzyme required for sulfatase activity